MKIRSLLLGSVAAAGLSTGAYAADLGVLTSLDVCDALGLSGLTISSDTNCLQITGGVNYQFEWGDWRGETPVHFGPNGNVNIITPDYATFYGEDANLDWDSEIEAWLRVVATADSDFGPARAVIGLRQFEHVRARNGGFTGTGVVGTGAGYVGPGFGPSSDDPIFVRGGDDMPLQFDEAYVSVGDSTVLMAGLKRHGINGSIANIGDDAGFGWVQPFVSSQWTGGGVGVEGGKDDPRFGGASIQVVSDLGNGLSVGAALENIDGGTSGVSPTFPGNPALAGTAVGVVSYAGDGITAHVTGAAFGILDGDVNGWLVHAGATASFDMFRIRGAVAFEDFTSDVFGVALDRSRVNALASVEATLDIFTLALTGEYYDEEGADSTTDDPIYGLAVNGGFNVTDGIALNLAGRWVHNENQVGAEDTYHVAAQLVASVTETIKLTGEVGGYFNDGGFAAADVTGDGFITTSTTDDAIYYGALEAAWTPGGNFSTSIKGEVFSTEAYRATFKASKSFE
ncbi:hypothetical protein EMQ25_05005 [Arsenicitalea aurantiaca]|uniref:Porin n=1 Tax=Arsenicitalea aurantiaca TaxID=1783274 RepID=A0A433XEM8_9HYPH|nr:hypothetical protein [Arsenicitalea aurantiaca]RUT32516.1 hypothetical protein EMQ25_05005 [Arsenicitalea aurantiaca]